MVFLQTNYNGIRHLTITKITDGVTISGIYTGVEYNNVRIHFDTLIKEVNKRTHTFGCEVVEVKNCNIICTQQGSNNIYYRESNNKRSISILTRSDGYGESQPQFIGRVSPGTNVEFSFTIKNLYCYEGAYINPPEIKSVDCLFTDSILHRDYDNRYTISLSPNITSAGRYRIFTMCPRYKSQIGCYSFRMYKSWSSLNHYVYECSVAILGFNTDSVSVNQKYYGSFKYFRTGGNVNNQIASVCITMDPVTTEIFFSINVSGNLGGGLRIDPLLDVNLIIPGKICYNGTKNTTDTVLATFNAVEAS